MKALFDILSKLKLTNLTYGNETNVVVMIEQSVIFRDLKKQIQTNDLLQWIETRAEELSDLGKTRIGEIIFAQKLRDACKIIEITAGKIGSRAQLSVEGDGFRIIFKPQLTEDARRFAIAHEIGHTIWYRPRSGTTFMSPTIVAHNDYVVEALCDYFAGALLIPNSAVLSILEANKQFRDGILFPPLHLIKQLAKKFNVQERIAAWRMLLLGNCDEYIILCARDKSNRNPRLFKIADKQPEWETLWYTTGNLFSKIRTVKGYVVPFNTKRRLPQEMIPTVSNGMGQTINLDNRWWVGLKPLPITEARRPLKYIRNKKALRLGYALFHENHLYLALPMKKA
jgi:Zn-dependent peptidase ImmA (M78 family)